MNNLDKAIETHLNNIQKKTGKSLDDLAQVIHQSGLTKHSEIRAMLQATLQLSYGDANMLALQVRKREEESTKTVDGATLADPLDAIYSGGKAPLRPIHDQISAALADFGEYETVPKKGYVSLRRKKQFAMLGPATKNQVELGLNVKDLPASDRLIEQPSGSMCNYKIRLGRVDEVDAELLTWLRRAYDSAG